MENNVRLSAADGHEFGAYRADPSAEVRGAVVVLQEIFGVNPYIRGVCDRLAAQGYVAIAPALFDRQVRDFETGYTPEDVEKARGVMLELDWSAVLLDIEAAAVAVQDAGPVAVIGFCMGGSLAFLGATRLDRFSAAVCYYGRRIVEFADETPRVPTLMHFGEQDATIPLSDVEQVRQQRSDCEIHLYPAGHGFDCDQRGAYEPESARLAWQRTLDWLDSAFVAAAV
ncbi:carboxymethylenebutenolidase [Marinobacterium nitratireducens]|uniref:Carboxymethylenebutenolidase n=1 Tax=Marinobacterium nitratireducens TaxID=518897 RepID=A0A917ZCW7_9GAMM|nr:dienelactone hydrolase family protein [Marinobacterium nitratireducens]GGO79387.1 carboxymethylenebutenolidase [Marinobacterium nitratireducens]